MYGVSEGPDLGWASAEVLGTVAAGVVLLAAMVAVELRTAEPIVALRLLGNRLFRSANGVMILRLDRAFSARCTPSRCTTRTAAA